MARSHLTVEERFWQKVEKIPEVTCWLWTGAAVPLGYGHFWNGTRSVPAHRFSYELHVGEIPSGLQIDHLCRVPACVNPQHLEPVTGRENTLRGVSFAAKNAAVTHCPKGHAYAGDNLRYAGRGRYCRECHRLGLEVSRVRRRADAIMRGDFVKVGNAYKTHCKYGHRLAGANLRVYIRTIDGSKVARRYCQACERERSARRWGKP